MRVLIVEDDDKIANLLIRGLVELGHSVETALDGFDGCELAARHPFDVAVVDLMLPRKDGLTLIGDLRRRSVNTPVLILSAKRTVDDRIAGLRQGGDDYLTKPFSFAELVARLEALVRRSRDVLELNCLELGDLMINFDSHQVARGGRKIDLTMREFQILECLARNPGRVVSRSMLLDAVWGYDFDPRANVVDARICKLREKIDKGHSRPLLHTIRGVGYALRLDD